MDKPKVRSSKTTWKSTGMTTPRPARVCPLQRRGLIEKGIIIGRTGLMLLECGTGAWRVEAP